MITLDDVKKYEQEIIDYRRSFHMYPETGFEEVRTSNEIARVLEGEGMEVVRGIATTGVVGTLEGSQKGRTVVLRADIDALNIPEQTELEFKSKNEGKMHACGHDGHTAMLLGAARILAQNRDRIKGTIKFVFQPAEEGPDPGGGILIMQSGVLTGADAAFALHLTPMSDTGRIAIHNRESMAATDIFKITLIGKGSHGAAPHMGIDPIVAAAQVINSFQSIVSRNTDPLDSEVVSIGTINGGSQFNAIPERVTLTGTVRSLVEKTRERVFEKMEAIVKGTMEMHKGSYKFERTRGYPALVNHTEMVDFAAEVCHEVLGPESVLRLDKPLMGGEDFAYYLNEIPGAMLWVGCKSQLKGQANLLHNAHFTIDEEALAIGTLIHVNLALRYLDGG
ncbi:MAG: amidohydrolase [Proteobacteria bacterium]|nr:amidohydrolase [Pseudomonadota bacterium]